jgi:hypothetical protein
MHYLLFLDELRINAWLIVPTFCVCVALLMIWAPRMIKSWKRLTVRCLGVGLLGLVALVFFIGFVASGDPPRLHIGFKSSTGSRAALLSHSSLRDGAATRVTVSGYACCRRYIAYEYYGDGDDYMDATSVKWIDDHHLAIRYARDPSGVQECHPQIDDVLILCDPQPDPFPRR